MMNLFSREEFVERRKMLRWFVEQVSEDVHNSEIDEMIGFVTDRLGLSYNDLEIISLYPNSYTLPALVVEDEKWMFYYKFLSAMNIDRNPTPKEAEICTVISQKLDMQDDFTRALISILPQYIKRRIPESVVKHSFNAIKKGMVAAAMVVPLGYVIGTTYS